MIAQEAATTARWAFGGVDSALSRARRGEDGGKAKVKVKDEGRRRRAKGRNGRARERVCRRGGGGYDGGEGTLAACSLGAAVEAAEALRGWRKAKWKY